MPVKLFLIKELRITDLAVELVKGVHQVFALLVPQCMGLKVCRFYKHGITDTAQIIVAVNWDVHVVVCLLLVLEQKF